ncbi:hypothetical protein QBC47DRAFT_394963 [Echria macrotheca]|uniref:Pentatricopeptide repeat domain-containing protein n=1 Tax=Echria macrotheca TaxID=438768 RepID=A0AAJ0B4E1_9PEZI|nr:hypothetical protein QBC47DRAFT_394963 [Echria macrotheca]
MSLGVSQHWRALPRHHVLRGLSTIPRGFPVRAVSQPCHSPIRPTRPCRFASLFRSSARFYATSNPEVMSSPQAQSDRTEPRETSASSEPATPQEPRDRVDTPPIPAAELMLRLGDVPVLENGRWQSVLIPPPAKNLVHRESHIDRVQVLKAIGSQAYLESHRLKPSRPSIADWQDVLALLVSNTPHYRPRIRTGQVKVVFPEQATYMVTTGLSQLQSLISKSGCYTERPDDPHDVLINGTVSAVRKAVDRILQIESRVTVIAISDGVENVVHRGAGPPSLKLWQEFKWGRTGKPAPALRAEHFPRPEQWTKETLESYVRELTSTTMSRSVERRLYTQEESHEGAVVEQLFRTLTSPSTKHAISLRAFKMALAHCTQAPTRYHTRAIRLFNMVDDFRVVKFDGQTFNLLLEAAVKASDLVMFKRTLEVMADRQVAPTLRTWILFLRITKSEESRRFILHAMHEKNQMVVPRAIPLIAAEMAKMDAHRALHYKQGLDEFLESQDKLYGPGWLTKYSANDILDVFSGHGEWDNVIPLLEMMCGSPTIAPTEGTMNILITHSARQGRIKRLIQVLKMLESRTQLVPGRLAYSLLFKLACWESKPQMLSVVWRYALLADAATPAILFRVGHLLQDGPRVNRLLKPYLKANKNKPDDLDPTLRKYVDSLLLGEAMPGGGNDAGESVGQQRQAILKSVREYYRQRRVRDGMEPERPLSRMLRSAVDLDRGILNSYVSGTRPLPMVPIEIPLRVRSKGVKVEGDEGVAVRKIPQKPLAGEV